MRMPKNKPCHSRLIAILCLAALAFSWAPHAHDSEDPRGHGAPGHNIEIAHATESPTGSSGISSAPQLSSDDAHNEHSSRSTATIEICLACRSGSESKLARAQAARVAIAKLKLVRVAAFSDDPAPRSLFDTLMPLRGPPATLL
jgi:hypothetical protein